MSLNVEGWLVLAMRVGGELRVVQWNAMVSARRLSQRQSQHSLHHLGSEAPILVMLLVIAKDWMMFCAMGCCSMFSVRVVSYVDFPFLSPRSLLVAEYQERTHLHQLRHFCCVLAESSMTHDVMHSMFVVNECDH